MVLTSLFLVSPIIDVATIIITAISATYVWRQETSEYNEVKGLLVLVHGLYIALVSLEFVRNFYSAPLFMKLYTIGNTSFVLLDVALLSIVALLIYLRPKGRGFLAFVEVLAEHRAQLAIFLLFCGYVVFAETALLVYEPFTIVQLHNMVGNIVNDTSFTSGYLDVLLGVLLVFIFYPSTILFITSRRTSDPFIKSALVTLPVVWIGIGLVILIFNGYLPTIDKVDDSAIGYLIAASAFSASALVFRRATVLSGFFTFTPTTVVQPPQAGQKQITRTLGLDPQRLVGRRILIEVDPIRDYEQVMKDFATEFTNDGYVVFAFTSRGSPVFSALSPVQNVRFFLLSEKVSYPKTGIEPNEMLVPRNEHSVLLSVLDKTLNTNQRMKVLIIFDSITDAIVSTGLESTYKFIKQANEMLGLSGATAIFLMTADTHIQKETNVVKSVFTEQLSYGEQGLVVTKSS